MSKYKLKNLCVTKVDFVDAGANQRANILIKKAAPEEEENPVLRLLTAIARKLGLANEQKEAPKDADGVPTEPEQKTELKVDEERRKKPAAKSLSKNSPKEAVEVKIDKSKMTEAERAFLESIEKRYAVEDKAEQETEPKEPVAKSAAEVLKEVAPEIASMMENVKKRLAEQENAKFLDVAKRYELLGKKPEELATVLKNVKAASEEAYKELVSSLDSVLDVAKRSGAFTELGRNGTGATDAEAKIAKRAAELREKNPSMSIYEARDKAFSENPELIKDFE